MKTHKAMENREIALLLKAVAAVYSLKKDRFFRVRTYEEAASSIEKLPISLKSLWKEDKLDQISGIGEAISSYLDELFKTGKVSHFQKLFKNYPKAMFEFMKISGIGPKKALKLSKKLKITSNKNAISRLKEAAEKGKIRKIEGFGEESEKNILEAIVFKDKNKLTERMLFPFAESIAKEVISFLKKNREIVKAEAMGSLRRKSETIGDLDIGVASQAPEKIISSFVKASFVKKIVSKGGNTARIIHQSDCQIDLKVINPNSFGSLLQHYTGSRDHNIALREEALKMGLSLSEHGIKTKRGVMRHFSNEKDFYNALKMQFIPPELREGAEEISLASQNKLPYLLEEKNIKGDMHLHSDFKIEPSHDLGQISLQNIVKKACEKEYNYIGLSEHNPSISNHSKNEIIDLLKRKRESIDKFMYSNKKNVQLKILNGLEVDIRPDGSLALPQEAIKILDYMIVSVHSSFSLSKEKMTKRVLAGLSNPKAVILGHPTGRLLGKRPPVDLDWDKLFEFSRKNKKILEINSHPQRLDLPDFLIKKAIKTKVMLVINSDAHRLDEMDNIKYGVSTARRGWAERCDIINTMSFKDLQKTLNI
jgi:DNA polymerase (family X)